MFDFKYVLKLNDNLIQFLEEKKTKIVYTLCVFTDEELLFFEIHFETLCIFRKNSEFGQSVSCR